MFEQSRDPGRQRDGIRDSSGNQPSGASPSPEEWDMALSYSKNIVLLDTMRGVLEDRPISTWRGLVGPSTPIEIKDKVDYRPHLRVLIKLLDHSSVGIDFADDVLHCISQGIGFAFEHSVSDKEVSLTYRDLSSVDQSQMRDVLEATLELGPVLEPPLFNIRDKLITALQRLALPVFVVEQQVQECSAITYRLQYAEDAVKWSVLKYCTNYIFNSAPEAIESRHYEMILMAGRCYADPTFLATASFTSLTSFHNFTIEVMEEQHPTLSFGDKSLWLYLRSIVDQELDNRFREPPESDTARLLRQLRKSFSSGQKVLAAAGAAALSAAALKLLASYF